METTERLIHFTKMHGARNDYIYVDLRPGRQMVDATGRQAGFPPMQLAEAPTLARALADRHSGVGGDGLILVADPQSESAHGRMIMFNADGSRGEMCGNGLRCVALILSDGQSRDGLRIETDRGILSADVLPEPLPGGRMVRLEMGVPIIEPAEIPTSLPGTPPLNIPTDVDGRSVSVSSVSMGNPHAVIFVDSLDDATFEALGPVLETHPAFPNGANVELVMIENRAQIRMRVWERGSGETQACGTGACAAVVAGRLLEQLDSEVNVELPGGLLRVGWAGAGSSVMLTGPAQKVFEGQWIFHGTEKPG